MARDRREYMRAYNERNREKIRERQREYRERNHEKIRERQREYMREYAPRASRIRAAFRRRISVEVDAKATIWGAYSAAEDSILRRTDIGLEEMALLTGRTYGSVNNRRFILRKKGLL